jgi:ferredoxin
MLVVFILLVAGGWGVTTADAGFAKVLRNTNLANLIVWSYWWPLIIIAVVLLGRAWCTVCPVELVSFVCGRIGLGRQVPAWLRTGWPMTVFYVGILLVGVHALAIHRLPHRMALYLLALVGVAVVVSLIFRRRAFCSYVCPVGHLLGLYAMVSPFQWRADDLDKCKSCSSKDCVAKENELRLVGRSCTSDLYPATITDNRDCLLCTQCLKACPYDNLRFSVTRPLTDLLKGVALKPAVVTFILVVSGFVVYEILSEWAKSKAILTWIPAKLTTTFGIEGPMAGFVSATVMFVLFPAVLFLVVGLLARLTSGESVGRVVKALAILLIPTMAGAHIIKSLLKMMSRIPYWSYAFTDPKGIDTAQAVIDNRISLNNHLPEALAPVVTHVSTVILVVSLAGTVLILRRSPTVTGIRPAAKVFVAAGSFVYWGVFIATWLLWRY